MTRRNLTPQRFERTGTFAIDPKAFFELFFVPETRAASRVGNVDVIEVSGPLVQRDDGMWCDSYEAIRARFRLACEGDAQAIVLRFDSPGGDASGCFETARALRAEAMAANKPLYAYVDKCCSAAYALACAATHGVVIGETCCAGSVGVMSSREDITQLHAQRGIRMSFVTSGQRKLDGNPAYPISEAELAETKRHVDELAGKFFALIGDMRPQLGATALASYDGAVFYGDGAVSAGLADSVATFEELLAFASTGEAMTLLAKTASDYDSARASLEKAAKGKDANAAAARRALAALTAEGGDDAPADDDDKPADEPASEGADDEPAADGGSTPAPAADGGDAPAPAAASSDDDEPTDDAGKKRARAAASNLQLHARLHTLEAKEAKRERADEKTTLIASRSDFSPEFRAELAKAPISTVREMVKNLPLRKAPKSTTTSKPAAITTVGATRGDTQVDPGEAGTRTRKSGADADVLDRAMGFSASKLGCRRDGATLYFGVMDADAQVASAAVNKPSA